MDYSTDYTHIFVIRTQEKVNKLHSIFFTAKLNPARNKINRHISLVSK